MAGGVFRKKEDQIVADIPTRDLRAAQWGIGNVGQGVIVLNAGKNFPYNGQGDPTVDDGGAYYKWTGNAFLKIGEVYASMDVLAQKLAPYILKY